MTTPINLFRAVNINGTQTPLLNIYSDILTYKDTNQNNLIYISSIPFNNETNNGIVSVDTSGGITLINPGIYKIDMQVIVSQASDNEGENNNFNTMLTTTYFNGSTNAWSGAVPLLYYNIWNTPTTTPALTITSIDAPACAAYIGYYNGFNGLTYISSNTLPGNPFINVQYKSNNGGQAYANYMSIHYIINSTTEDQKIYFTTQAPGAGSLYMGLVTAVVNLTSTNVISL